ncbi:hypothetical protein Ocin01_10659 [Orchesella cincta]|uniref:Uncharacterized protein n=1 Tax=Orchesella cincta TaxID=48709 RepID=A0A1D2MT96_ORCCI|nr:hypothetical protein Ocin01_10659 [Orchesella cincta]
MPNCIWNNIVQISDHKALKVETHLFVLKMDRNAKGQYQSNQYHGGGGQHQGNNAPYPWAQNGMTPMYRGQSPPSAHPPRPNDRNMYYNQAQASHPAPPQNAGMSNHSYPNQQSFPPVGPPPQYGQQMNNPWGHYNQTQSYNNAAVTNAPTQAPAGQSYNQFMYPPPPPPTAVNNLPNQNQQNMPYAAAPPPPVHSYYQMQQPNYYYPPNQMYPTAVPPPPLPPPPVAKPEMSSSSENSSRETSVSSDSKSTKSSSSSSSDKASNSKKDMKSQPPPTEEKEKEEKETKKAVPIMVGKRRGGRVLPTGVVKKQKVEDDSKKGKSDAWSQYMAEVRRYKDQSCTEERQNRPLVK